jgi:hypothetical protein
MRVARQGFAAPLFFILGTVPAMGTFRFGSGASQNARYPAGYRNNQTAVPIAAQKSKAAKTTMTMAESTPYTVLDRAMGGTESEYSVMQIILPRTIAWN